MIKHGKPLFKFTSMVKQLQIIFIVVLYLIKQATFAVWDPETVLVIFGIMYVDLMGTEI